MSTPNELAHELDIDASEIHTLLTRLRMPISEELTPEQEDLIRMAKVDADERGVSLLDVVPEINPPEAQSSDSAPASNSSNSFLTLEQSASASVHAASGASDALAQSFADEFWADVWTKTHGLIRSPQSVELPRASAAFQQMVESIRGELQTGVTLLGGYHLQGMQAAQALKRSSMQPLPESGQA
ncbi:hypothetical protein [Leptolyngbya sp. FACHB-261]|uniref:hypothetical protein n=1 Tax=Leptolyngbya sp. FACHB-261 TaxID=2692806 RepID=UPI001682E4E0|nr:hypothetical protein [Leptolyngbya sp. FACHB-261]MBD2105181.1 hypothetical protein [Leptolyngbya sp. FACHB-261]